MPVYNAAPYLRRALDSVCKQTFRDLEILCVNDGSTDESPAILAEYAARDARIRVIDHGENRGYACAMNSGFDAACGETVGIVDADDAISKNFFAELWNVYEKGGCDIAKGRLRKQSPAGKWQERYINDAIKKDPFSFFWQWTSAIYSLSFIRKYSLKLSMGLIIGQDALFLYQLMGHEPRIAFTEKAIYYYLCNSSSMTQAHPAEFYLTAHLRIARLLKECLHTYPHEGQRRKLFEAIIKFLERNLNQRYALCDWSPYFTEIKAILDNDEFYTPLKTFPFLRLVLKARNIQELKTILKSVSRSLMATSWRENLRQKTHDT